LADARNLGRERTAPPSAPLETAFCLKRGGIASFFSEAPLIPLFPVFGREANGNAGATKKTKGKYAVWVYMKVSGQWVKQPERTFQTDSTQAANDYVAQVRATKAWTATTNAPEPAVEPLVGKWTGRETSHSYSLPVEYLFHSDGTFHVTYPDGSARGTWCRSGRGYALSLPNTAVTPAGTWVVIPQNGKINHSGPHPEGGTVAAVLIRGK